MTYESTYCYWLTCDDSSNCGARSPKRLDTTAAEESAEAIGWSVAPSYKHYCPQHAVARKAQLTQHTA